MAAKASPDPAFPTFDSPDPQPGGPAYSAPALEKGLDILELLAREGRAMGTRQIAEGLGRSKNEIFRMLHVLMSRGYLWRDPASDELTLTNRLFDLGVRTARARDLTGIAIPVIGQLALEIGQAVHLVVAHRAETVIIAASSGGSDLNFSLKLGYRRPLADSHSGLVLMAFQDPARQVRMLDEALAFLPDPPPRLQMLDRLAEVQKAGAVVHESRDIIGLTDYCCPVLAPDGTALACVTVVAFGRRKGGLAPDGLLDALQGACARIGADLARQMPPALDESRPA